MDFSAERDRMVVRQIAARGVRDRAVLDAMREVPRERFVDADFASDAYCDTPLPIGAEQTISQPYIVAAMIEAAALSPASRVLEIGAGSGYAAAVISRIAAQVFAIERHAALADRAAATLAALGYTNVRIRTGDGCAGWPEEAPFDAIIVSAGAAAVPAALREQLAVGGRLVIPVDARFEQRLLRITRIDADRFDEADLGGVRFVPLVGS